MEIISKLPNHKLQWPKTKRPSVYVKGFRVDKSAEFKPLLIKQSYRNEDYQHLIDSIDNLAEIIFKSMAKESIPGTHINTRINDLIQLAAKLYQFKKAEPI